MSEVGPKATYDARLNKLESIEQSFDIYKKHEKKEVIWARARKVVAVAPWVAAAALMSTRKVEGLDEKMITNAGALYASLIGFIYADHRKAKHAGLAYKTAKSTSTIYDEMGLVRARWVEEGLKKSDQDLRGLKIGNA